MWQVIWAYGVGFWMLRQIRHVKDVYHWYVSERAWTIP